MFLRKQPSVGFLAGLGFHGFIRESMFIVYRFQVFCFCMFLPVELQPLIEFDAAEIPQPEEVAGESRDYSEGAGLRICLYQLCLCRTRETS